MKLKELDWAAFVFMVIGALNWGLVGAFRLDLIETILSTSPGLVQVVYILVGLSGLYWLYKMTSMKK
ncbi:MAG: DUF378 domain-containing protein [bacterium]|nr:DUF378 domain-containing protein [bacterium]